MISRRKLLVALGAGALGAPLASFAQQQPAKIPRIGFLGATSATGYARQVEALRAGLRELGYRLTIPQQLLLRADKVIE